MFLPSCSTILPFAAIVSQRRKLRLLHRITAATSISMYETTAMPHRTLYTVQDKSNI